MQHFNEILDCVQSRCDLTENQTFAAMDYLLSGRAGEPEILQFLSAMHAKGETEIELTGAASALRASMIPIASTRRPVLDTCGTGGDGSKTFNISTAAAIVLAATGQPVAKHGNRKITSRTGSADVLSELGINIQATPDVVQRCLEEIGICFCFAPCFHPCMKHVGPARSQLSHPTIFNRLGPLVNPAKAECQVLGVGDEALQDRMALALQRLGTRRSIVVRGEDGVDEISISAPTRVLEVTTDSIREHRWTPEMFGAERTGREGLYADDPVTSAHCIRRVLAGEPGARCDVVVINAAAALWLVHPEKTLIQCAQRAREAIQDGSAEKIVRRLAESTI